MGIDTYSCLTIGIELLSHTHTLKNAHHDYIIIKHMHYNSPFQGGSRPRL